MNNKNSRHTFFTSIISITTAFVFLVACETNVSEPETKSSFLKAKALLEQSNQELDNARKTILQANMLRKDINKLRSKARRTTNHQEKTKLEKQADELAQQLIQSQFQGAAIREKSKQLILQAKEQIRGGFENDWKKWVQNSEPLTMNDSVKQFIAHNTQIRSVHPTMLNKMGTPTDQIAMAETSNDMTLMLPALADQKAPTDLDIGAFQISREQQYYAHIEVNEEMPTSDNNVVSSDNKNVSAVPLNKIHQWKLLVSDSSGAPVDNATIIIEGHMPGHVHGLPTQPRVTEQIAPGVYRVEGVKFQMKGWWVMKFIFNPEQSSGAPDEVTFNLVF